MVLKISQVSQSSSQQGFYGGLWGLCLFVNIIQNRNDPIPPKVQNHRVVLRTYYCCTCTVFCKCWDQNAALLGYCNFLTGPSFQVIIKCHCFKLAVGKRCRGKLSTTISQLPLSRPVPKLFSSTSTRLAGAQNKVPSSKSVNTVHLPKMWRYALDFGWHLYLSMTNAKKHSPSPKEKMKKKARKTLILVKMSVELNESAVICTHEGRKKEQQVC